MTATPPLPQRVRRWPWILGGVVALGVGFGIGFVVQPEPEPEIVTETVTEVEYQTPQECEMAIDAAYELIQAFDKVWEATSSERSLGLSIDDLIDNQERYIEFGESLEVLTPRWQEYASECDPRYDY